MSEVPEHLLQRSRERRIALGLATADGGDAPAPAAPPAGGVPAAPAAAAPAPVAAAAPAAPIAPEPPPPPRPRPGPARVPTWVIPALAALPLWGFLYLGIFGERGAEGEPVVSGSAVYSQNCASCHGAGGEGGVGPPLEGGLSNETFPDREAHVQWVKQGSQPVAGQPYGATGKIATGGMPGFEGSLSEEEIQAVVDYERDEL
jgi:mono/diheme cytochrome c family protein